MTLESWRSNRDTKGWRVKKDAEDLEVDQAALFMEDEDNDELEESVDEVPGLVYMKPKGCNPPAKV